jgi:hypothetical protein
MPPIGVLVANYATAGRGVLTLWVLLTAGLLPAQDGAEPPGAARSQYEIKSATLYNFTKFVRWPDRALGAEGVPVLVGVWHDDHLVPALETALRNKTIQGHPIMVERLDSTTRAKGCAVLFVGASSPEEIARIVQSVGRLPVLTIGDRAQFSRLGGIVAFTHDANRIQLDINSEAAERAGLQVSSKLLRMAVVWREPLKGAPN